MRAMNSLALSSVAISFEVKPQLEDPIGKLTAKSMSVGIFPFSVYNLKGNVLIRRSSMKSQNSKVLIVWAWLKEVLRSRAFINEIWIKNVEFVTLDNFRRRIVKVIMSLVVLVPLKACMHSVEEAWLSRPVFICPQVHFSCDRKLHTELGLVVAHSFSGAAHKSVFCTLTGITCKRHL